MAELDDEEERSRLMGFSDAKQALGIDQPTYDLGTQPSGGVGINAGTGQFMKGISDNKTASDQLDLLRNKRIDQASDEGKLDYRKGAIEGTSLAAKRRRMNQWFMTPGMQETGAAWQMLGGAGA